MKHEDKNQTFDDVLRNVAKTGFPDKEAMRARILSHAEGRQANKSAYYATDNNGASDAGSQKTVTGGGNGDRMQPHRRRQRPRWQKLAAAGGLIAAALAIVLIATSLLNRPESPLDDPETTLPPVTESTTARDDESFATTGETEGRTEQTEDVTEPAETEPVESEHYIDGILVEQGMLYSSGSDLGPVSFDFPETHQMAKMEIGGHYRLSFDGLAMESYPVQIRVSKVELLDSADSEWIAEADINAAVNYLRYNPSAYLVDARESSDHETGIIPIPNSYIEEDQRKTILLPLTNMAADPEETATVLSASVTPEPGSPRAIVFVYADTQEDSVEAARLIKDAGYLLTISLGAMDDYDGDIAELPVYTSYTEYTGYLLQDDLFFAESALQQSRYSITYFEGESADSDREYPVYIHTLQDRIALDEVANAEFEPTSEPMGFPRYLLNVDHDGQDMEFYLDSRGVATGPLLGEGNYRISSIDADTAFNTIDRIYRSQPGRLSPGLVQITPGSFPAPATIGGRYRVEISDVMTASNPPLATIREAVALEDSEPDVIRELPIWIVSEHLHLFDSATLIDVRSATEYESGFIPVFKADPLNLPLPLAELRVSAFNVKAFVEASAAPDVALEEHLVLVYGNTSEEAAEAVRLLKEAGIPAVLSIGSIDNYDQALVRRPDPLGQTHSFEMDGIEFLLEALSPTDILLEARPVEDDVLIATTFNYEYAIDVKRGEAWEPAPLVFRSDNDLYVNELAYIDFDDRGGYRITQAVEVGFESVPSTRYIEFFDLTKHTVLEPGETYRLSKSFRFTVGDTELEEKTYEFEFRYE